MAGRRAAHSKSLKVAARAGFVARGAIYLLIGFIAVQVAVGHGGQADRGGALAQIAAKSYGTFVLWLLVVGFAGLALWRFSEAAFGAVGPDGHKASERLKSLARALLYSSFFVSTLQFVTGTSSGATANGNNQSRTLTARVMEHNGGRLLVGLIGLVVLVIGAMLAREGWKKEFLKRMDFGGASFGTRSLVEKLGVVGSIARGAVVAVAGVFLIIAAVRFSPSKAEGIDGSLRAFAHTPLGPFLLILVALGLVAFGLFSWCEARWRRV
jgi:vacuolar-type H+-ATPase subunit I/STV1